MKNYKLYIGLNDKNTLEQIIDTQKAIEIICNIIKEYKKGFSLVQQKGGYMMESGQYVFENSLALSIFEINEKQLFNFCDIFKKVFNQESILIVEITESPLFY